MIETDNEKLTSLYENNLKLVPYIYNLCVKRYKYSKICEEEVLCCGRVGLFRACQLYVKKPKDYKFSTLACTAIKHEITSYFRRLNSNPTETALSLEDIIAIKDESIPMEERIEDKDEKNRVIELLKEVSNGLSDDYKQVFDYLLDGKSHIQISKLVNLTRQEVSRKASILIKRLKLLLCLLMTDKKFPRIFDFTDFSEYKITIQKYCKSKFLLRTKPNLDNLKLDSIIPIRNRLMKNNDEFVDNGF